MHRAVQPDFRFILMGMRLGQSALVVELEVNGNDCG
jgi:hypothetical protein